jgi:hypothetical protein
MIKIVQIILECDGELCQASVPPHMDVLILDFLRAEDGRIKARKLPDNIVKTTYADLAGVTAHQSAPAAKDGE